VMVPTGGHSSRELAKAGADVVLRNLEDFPAWLHRDRDADVAADQG
jgi:phosphoglycolate phosphatase-like HAD superfamily hydrolase